jgi:methylated-DNA-protein-cysteine methyltransferase-like protein
MQPNQPCARPGCRSPFAINKTAFKIRRFFFPLDSDKFLAMRHPVGPQNLKRRILKDSLRENETRDAAFRRIIRSVPKGKVSTYGKVAAAAGYPLYHRAVARLLRRDMLLPWQRIVGAGGEIKLRGEAAAEQHFRLSIEGVKFRGKRVNMEIYEHTLRSWESHD